MSEKHKISEQSVEKIKENMQKCTHQSSIQTFRECQNKNKNINIKVKFFSLNY